MIHRNAYLSILIISIAFAGCATMKKEECLTANWYEIGYEDGIKGYEPHRISNHRKACAEYGVSPDFTLYQQGREKGLVEFCTPNRGFVLGLNGRAYKDICPNPLKNAFSQGYRNGRQIYEFEQDLHNKEKDLDRLNHEITKVQIQIDTLEARLAQDCKNADVCRISIDKIRGLDRLKSRLKQSVRMKKESISTMKLTLSEMKTHTPY